MSFVDLATLTLHRQNELEARINVFLGKCDHAIEDIQKLKVQAQNFVLQLNCEPSELKERFLNCMKQLDEFTYLITDFNISVGKLDELSATEFTPVHDHAAKTPLPTPCVGPINLMDVLSEPTPSTSTACPNLCPTEKPKRIKVPKEDQLLIAFSSASCSSESVPLTKSKSDMDTVETAAATAHCELEADMSSLSIKAPQTPIILDACNLPAQKILQTDHCYPATIMSIDEVSFWVITDSIDDVCMLMKDMTEFYNHNQIELGVDEIGSLNYCAFYDDESDCFYRALFIKLIEDVDMLVEVFLVDTGEVRAAAASNVQPLEPRFCAHPPYARCCHLAGGRSMNDTRILLKWFSSALRWYCDIKVELLSYQNKKLMVKQESFMKEYVGTSCTIEIDDNTSESLGVFVILPSKRLLNDIIIQEGLALPNKPKAEHPRVQGPPELARVDSALDITDCPEYEDPVEAVTGYSNRDEADICKHYKGGPDKTCFKGARCTKKHVVKHPDGWTLDRAPVAGRLRAVPLPPPGAWLRALVTYVCHFDRLYVQLVGKEDDDAPPSFGVILPPTTLTALVRDMNSPAARMTYKPLKLPPAPGELVAALYPLDNQWYRARVLTVTRADQNVEVMYVDYGNVVWVKEDEVRVLEGRYLPLPAQAVRCVLAGVGARSACSRQWAAAKQALAGMAQDRTLDAHVVGRDYDELIVELYDKDGYSISEQLAAQDFVELKEYAFSDDTKVTQKVVAA